MRNRFYLIGVIRRRIIQIKSETVDWEYRLSFFTSESWFQIVLFWYEKQADISYKMISDDPFKRLLPNQTLWKLQIFCTVYGKLVSGCICSVVDILHLQNGYIVRSLKKSLQKYTSCVYICQKTKKVIIHPYICLPTPDNTMCSFPHNSFAISMAKATYMHARRIAPDI